MNTDTPNNSREDARTSSQPVQRKDLAGPLATFILPETAQEIRPISAGGLRRTCVHLGDADRAAIQQIKERLEIPNSALVVRLAIRKLAERLAQPRILADT